MAFERVKAYPDGTVHFIYGDRIVSQKRDEPPIIRINTHKDIYGLFDGSNNLPISIRQLSPDELHDDFCAVD